MWSNEKVSSTSKSSGSNLQHSSPVPSPSLCPAPLVPLQLAPLGLRLALHLMASVRSPSDPSHTASHGFSQPTASGTSTHEVFAPRLATASESAPGLGLQTWGERHGLKRPTGSLERVDRGSDGLVHGLLGNSSREAKIAKGVGFLAVLGRFDLKHIFWKLQIFLNFFMFIQQLKR